MAEIKLELTKSRTSSFPLLTPLELEAVIHVIRTLTRAWQLGGGLKDER